MKNFLAILFLFAALTLNAATYCVGPSATGSGSGADWNNQKAWGNTMVRGDTWYLRGSGTYASMTMTGPASSGTTRCTIKKASPTDHVTETGWVAAYGTAQAEMGTFHIDSATSGYWTIDGSYPFGINFQTSTSGREEIVNFVRGGANSIIKLCEINGPGGATDFNYDGDESSQIDQQGIGSWGGEAVNSLIQSNYIHGTVTATSFSDSGIVVEHNIFGDMRVLQGTYKPHNNIIYIGFQANNITFRYNLVTNYNSEGVFITWYSTASSPPQNIYVYGNVFSSPGTTTTPRGVEIRQFDGSGSGQVYRNIKVYNNTFIDLSTGSFLNRANELGRGSSTGVEYINNIERNAGHILGDSAVVANNLYDVAANTFVNIGAGDFHLAAATASGTTLASPYNQDPDGLTRGNDGVWDIGAYEYGGGPDVTPPTLSTVTIGTSGTTATLAFNEAVTFGAGGNAGLALTMTGGAITFTYASGSGTASLVYNLSRTVADSETVTSGFNYTQPGNGIEDSAGNDLATVSGKSVVNNSQYNTSPVTQVTSGSAVGTTNTLFSYTIQGNNLPSSFSSSNLPSGLSRSGAVISGFPDTLQTNLVTLWASNFFGGTATNVTFEIRPQVTTLYYGNTNINAGSFDTISAQSINAMRWQNTNAMNAVTMYAKVGANSGRYKMAIYTDASSLPNTLVAQTVTVTNAAAGWTNFDLTASVTLSSNTWYWIAIWSDTASGVYYSSGSPTFRYGTLTFGTWPDPITLASSGSSIAYAMYAAGSPPSGQAPTDTTPPTISSFTMPAVTTSYTATLTHSESDNVAVTGWWVSESSSTPAFNAFGWLTETPTNFAFYTTGNKTLYLWVKDGAGNVSSSASATTEILGSPTIFYASPTGSSTNDGLHTNAPWPLTYALQHVGDSNIITVMNGTYSGSDYVVTNSWITIQAQNRWQARLTDSPGSCLSITDTNFGVNGVVMDGLCISNSLHDAIEIYSGSNIVIRNCWLLRAGQNYVGGINNQSGISCSPVLDIIIERNLIELNGVNASLDHGVYISGTNGIIRNNVIRSNAAFGIQLYPHSPAAVDGCQVYGNLVYGNGTAGAAFGIGEMVVYPAYSNKTNSIYGNTIVSTNPFAIQVQSGTFAYFTNNIIISAGSNAFYPSGTNYGDYNLSHAALRGAGAHDVVTSSFGFANTNRGLFWLASTSAARGAALSTVFGPVDFLGATQTNVTDIGFNQYSVPFATDTRNLAPSGSDFWTNAIPAQFGKVFIGNLRIP